MKKKLVLAFAGILLLAVFPIQTTPAQQAAALQIRHFSPEIQNQVENTNYKDVRIKKFPIAVQCWSYRRFSFLETLAKLKELGVEYAQAYPGQALGAEFPNVKFDDNLTDEQLAKIQDKLKEAGVSIVAYGVCDIGTTEESMRKVFNFARKMGFRTIVTEPADDDFTLLEKMVKEYNIQIAIHNHPEPNKYAKPETVYDRVKGRDERIGSCADTGHWMRGMNNPLEALRLLEDRIIDTHLKDRTGYGSPPATDSRPTMALLAHMMGGSVR